MTTKPIRATGRKDQNSDERRDHDALDPLVHWAAITLEFRNHNDARIVAR